MSTVTTSKLRLRHPKGQATLELDLHNATVQDLQNQIRAISDVPPSYQELKFGYPPRQLTLIPELPVSSLGLKAGDQIILTQKAGSASVPSSTSAIPSHAAPPSTPASAGARSAPRSAGMDYGNTSGGDIGKAQSIRRIVAEAIQRDAETWTEAMLGHPREKYIQTMLKPWTWGGAIELSIFATHYNTEVASIDVETGRIDRFSPSSSSAAPTNRCILLYSGIHYDTVSLAPMMDAPPDFHQTVFPIEGEDTSTDSILRAASQLADKLRAKRAYTNTATFDLRCEICKMGLKGEKGARDHAMQTGHTAFGEY